MYNPQLREQVFLACSEKAIASRAVYTAMVMFNEAVLHTTYCQSILGFLSPRSNEKYERKTFYLFLTMTNSKNR